ncbi:PhzF family phenazine biosynthesis protein [Asanoa sp. NPDC050611]|uniref:PhzF family phenazine biosynthesis protein n=1 Tax=Asanoa sp. NPDC050611 TaxID=3157098 RepID=UPI0033E6A757
MRYHHVDVFTGRPFSGNSVAVFPDAEALTTRQMSLITTELRHFESIFLGAGGAARVFDLSGELDFAGHPVLGAACVLHALRGSTPSETWTLRLPAGAVKVATTRHNPTAYAGVLDQGPPSFLGRPSVSAMLPSLSLAPDDLDPTLPPEVVSTGLRYLVLPVRTDALARARVTTDLTAPLTALGAEFAYLLDAATMEGRHWNNDGVVEDVATGSGAGCVAAYLRSHDRIDDGKPTILRQGRFTGRPSEMTITAHGDRSVEVGGDVVLVAEGRLLDLPR